MPKAKTLTEIIAEMEGQAAEGRAMLAAMLGLFPPDHPIRKLAADFPNLQSEMGRVTPAADAATALRKIGFMTEDPSDLNVFRFADAIRAAVQRTRAVDAHAAEARGGVDGLY